MPDPVPPYPGVLMPEKYRDVPYADLPSAMKQRIDSETGRIMPVLYRDI